MIWAYPYTFWGFLLFPLMISAAVVSSRHSRHYSIEWQVRTFLRDLSMMVFFVLALLSAAEPMGGRKPVSGERYGLDIAVAFDISRSMLAEDITPSRLNRSVNALRQITRSFEDTRFSLIPFKGDASLAVPMTGDRVIMDLWIDKLGPGLSTVTGTDVEAALETADASFPGDDGRNKVILLITDGEALKGHVERASRQLAEKGVPVYILGAGSEEGSTIPLADGSYVKDSDGRPVVSRMDTKSLKRLSDNTGGSFQELSRPGAVGDLITDIGKDRDLSENRGIQFLSVNRYRLFLFPSLIFLLFFLLVRITPWGHR